MEEISNKVRLTNWIQRVSHIGILLLIIPATLNNAYLNLILLLLGVNFINKGIILKETNKRNFYYMLCSGVFIILVSLYRQFIS